MVSNIPQNHMACNSSKDAVHMMTKSRQRKHLVWRGMPAMGRIGQSDEVAAALFLCSEAFSNVTREVRVVDGGYSTRRPGRASGRSDDL
jgi:NAD(P)-dependent dehydrogenase (short-subunit alcohol dehydrogenase family)